MADAQARSRDDCRCHDNIMDEIRRLDDLLADSRSRERRLKRRLAKLKGAPEETTKHEALQWTAVHAD